MTQQYGSGGDLTVTLAGPFAGGGSGGKVTQVTLFRDAWKGAASPYSQVVEMEGGSIGSLLSLYPTARQLEQLRLWGTGLSSENEDGVFTVYALGNLPPEDMTLQGAFWEVTV